jgi:hypothetical protein
MVETQPDLNRHLICDAVKLHYYNEPASLLQAADSGVPIPSNQFLTATLRDAVNSAPHGHRGDVDEREPTATTGLGPEPTLEPSTSTDASGLQETFE